MKRLRLWSKTAQKGILQFVGQSNENYESASIVDKAKKCPLIAIAKSLDSPFNESSSCCAATARSNRRVRGSGIRREAFLKCQSAYTGFELWHYTKT
jgi:hypothetical protein